MKTSASDPFRHQLNARNAKKVAVLVVIGFTAYHTVLHVSYGIDSCKWLLSDGRFQGYHVWQPYGCMLHNYSRTDSRMCMRYIAYWGGKNTIVFVGDSRMRQIYSAFRQLISIRAGDDFSLVENDLNLELQFKHLPILNSSVAQAFQNWSQQEPKNRPKIVVAGCGIQSIKENNASMQSLEDYRANLTRLLPEIDRFSGSGSSQILWLLQHPVKEEKLSEENSMITNEQIDLYNKAALDVLKYVSSNVHVWSSSRLLSQGWAHDEEDGIHMGSVALAYSVQILLNMYCNDQMNFNDGSCCSDPEPVTGIQIMTFVFYGITCVFAVAIMFYKWFFTRRYRDFELLMNQEPEATEMDDLMMEADMSSCSSSSPVTGIAVEIRNPDNKAKSYSELFNCLAKISLIMIYAFICDRTNFFMKENKYYTAPNYFLPIAYVFALGLFFTDESKSITVLHQDQMDECKGWLMLVILSYNMTGAAQVLSIYVDYHLLVTSYLFIFGFQHFQHFWHKGDSGFRRLWQVLFRLNLLTVFLCLTMNRPYQFYYYVPLVTFWFIVIHLTLTSMPHVTSQSVDAKPVQYLYMLIKFLVLLSIVTILYMSEVLFAKIFLTRPWKALFVTTDDSISDWWFRWKVDRYSVPAGMIFAFLYEVMKKHKFIDDSSREVSLFHTQLNNAIAVLCSLIGFAIYASFSFMCRNESECNEIHAYISFLPIISFIVLRNISGIVRCWYSSFFAWFGRISLELFILQYHIWLAANTHGVLVLVPSYPVLNVLVTIFIFICCAHEMHSLTNKLSRYAISSDWRYMTRNIVIFLLILIPIGIKDGMF